MNKYYIQKLCPFCLKYKTKECREKFQTNEQNNTAVILCLNYQRNYEQEEITEEVKEESIKPLKYYFKNYREV